MGFYPTSLPSGFVVPQVSSASLERSYRRAPKGASQCKKYADDPPGICHLCMGGTKEGDWEDLTLAKKH